MNWIKCSERLPKYNDIVGYTYHANKRIEKDCWFEHQFQEFWEDKEMCFAGEVASPVTHWMQYVKILPPED